MNKGFTLIEVLLATMVLAGALVALSSSWSGTVFSFQKSEKISVITSLLKSKATELDLKYSKLSYSEIPEEETGDFGKDFEDLTWKSEVKEMEFPDLTPLILTEAQTSEMELMVIRQMTDHFSKNIKEIKITIFWKSTAKKPLEYSITSYIINYSGGLPSLGGGS